MVKGREQAGVVQVDASRRPSPLLAVLAATSRNSHAQLSASWHASISAITVLFYLRVFLHLITNICYSNEMNGDATNHFQSSIL